MDTTTASSAPPAPTAAGAETLDELHARHRREKKDLQGRITNKKKNASKKTRRGVNDECAAMERDLAERQALELGALHGGGGSRADGESEVEEDGVDAVADGLAGTTIAPAPAPAPNPAPAPAAQPKRNRQKERLARRAAEQEALVASAAAEASTMTDHRGAERKALAATLATHGLTEHEIPPDGHCLFSAVADQLITRLIAPKALNGARATAGLLRNVAADYMLAHAETFAPFVTAEDGEPTGLEAYVERIRNTAEWGGQLELQALAEACEAEIVVVRREGEHVIKPKTENEVRRLWLAYYVHGFGLGEHYNSLRGGKA
ncbi:Ubiquitin thioesterase otu2 [Ceratocystis platani]|uniref:Ubiquitin thioesterase otu2 n=1 Tax=Ceratocystis fimbriata f. sp. platani TaxID=88771 RepID=A0A0F8B150_CERFI|nr:Ubiquitin thioesterase otu2 [Ceratocystis platani]